MKKLIAIATTALLMLPAALTSAASGLEMQKANSLDELLQMVEQRRLHESRESSQRVAEFQREKAKQQQRLNDAKATRKREEQRSERLEAQFEENEVTIGNLQEALDKRLGSLRELFGVLQQVSGDARGVFEGSLVSAEIPGRGEWLSEFAKKMGTSSQLATIEEMETLWFELQREMTETGKVSKFQATVETSTGEKVETEVIRVGAFNLIANEGFVNFVPGTQVIKELPRQPPARFSNTAAELSSAGSGTFVPFAIDPTRGSLLSLVIQGKTISERVQDGGTVGYIIIGMGVIGVLLALERVITLTLVGGAVRSQAKSVDNIKTNNPLGRVLKVYDDNRDVDVETLELKLGEAILGETPRLTRNISLIQVISVVAPLMGLLGTVIGMILTFQAITLFGTGDPQTMAGGISTALMTTVLGLCVAIPTTLLHSIVNGRSKSVIHTLEEQSAGIIARHAENSGKALG